MREAMRREPVRAAIWSVVSALTVLGVALGYIDDGQSATITAIAALLLGVSGEAARAKVTPVAKMNREQVLD